MFSYSMLERAKNIKALVLDVDGILSNGQLFFTNTGDEIKAFHVRDGFGMKLVQMAGVKIVIITGRSSNIVNTRMTSLGVDLIIQGREDKGAALKEACTQLAISPSDCAYMGDDWPDLSALAIAGLKLTVPHGHAEVKKCAHFITTAHGGEGAVREICDLIITAKGCYTQLLNDFSSSEHT